MKAKVMTPEQEHAWYMRLNRSALKAGDSATALHWAKKARQAARRHRCEWC